MPLASASSWKGSPGASCRPARRGSAWPQDSRTPSFTAPKATWNMCPNSPAKTGFSDPKAPQKGTSQRFHSSEPVPSLVPEAEQRRPPCGAPRSGRHLQEPPPHKGCGSGLSLRAPPGGRKARVPVRDDHGNFGSFTVFFFTRDPEEERLN